jgi:hypothetical protein
MSLASADPSGLPGHLRLKFCEVQQWLAKQAEEHADDPQAACNDAVAERARELRAGDLDEYQALTTA